MDSIGVCQSFVTFAFRLQRLSFAWIACHSERSEESFAKQIPHRCAPRHDTVTRLKNAVKRDFRQREIYAKNLTKRSCRGIFLPFLIAFIVLVIFSIDTKKILAQEQVVEAVLDSAAINWAGTSVYEIDRLRLLRWVRAHQDTSARDFLRQTLDLITEAGGFARQGDHTTAQLLLDTALELTGLRISLANPEATELLQVAPLIETSVPKSFEWKREVLFGVDLRRQEFELGFADQESLYVDRDGNPFAGLRLSLNHNATPPLNTRQSSLSRLSLQPEARGLNFDAYALLKSSRDYYSGEIEFNGRQSLGDGAFWRFQNRLEGTSYRRDFDLQYWQNTATALAAMEIGKNFRLEVADEFRVRRYRHASEIYPNYLQNQASLGTVYNSGYTSRLEARYHYVVRAHASCPADDYIENRFDASVFQNASTNTSILLENIWRQRNYLNNTPGSPCRKTYQNTYQEEYARADLRLGFSDALALRLEGDFTLRQHAAPSDTTPDFLGATVNPQLQIKFFSSVQMSIGYLYLLRVYDKDIIQTAPPADLEPSSFLFYEDYYAHGFTLGVDLIRTGGLLLSVNENFEMRTYPNSATQDITGFGLYSDRNINSLLLFFSWNFLPHWQAGALANFDNDYSRVENRSDSRNTLFSIDLSYSF